ncbi:VOC family protein [Planctobacterium marinum]|uniref:VOC family protein n=1 Tax=Planctobacterium marinum TaxID=1631968 RepID=UPI0030C6E5E2
MISGINHLTFAVSDLEVSLDFYSNLLGLAAEVKWNNGAYLSGPGIWLCLTKGRPNPDQDYSHVAFSVESEQFTALQEKIVAAGFGTWQENTSEGDSLYFLDPDNHKLEIHCGNLSQRLDSLKQKPYAGLKWLNSTDSD